MGRMACLFPDDRVHLLWTLVALVQISFDFCRLCPSFQPNLQFKSLENKFEPFSTGFFLWLYETFLADERRDFVEHLLKNSLVILQIRRDEKRPIKCHTLALRHSRDQSRCQRAIAALQPVHISRRQCHRPGENSAVSTNCVKAADGSGRMRKQPQSNRLVWQVHLTFVSLLLPITRH